MKKVVIDNEWLRVRKDPGGLEIGQAKQGEEFDYLGEVAEGWVKIQFKPGVVGYVSKQLVKLK